MWNIFLAGTYDAKQNKTKSKGLLEAAESIDLWWSNLVGWGGMYVYKICASLYQFFII